MNSISLKTKNAENYLVAHRGYTSHYPENTLAAIQAALDAGAKYIEIDIQLTKDKQPVLFHDRDLHRLCERQQAIHNYALGEIKAFSSFSPERFGDKFKGEAIPLLLDVVSLIRNYPEVILFVEFKRISIDRFGIDEMLKAVLPAVESIVKQCVFISFSLDLVEAIRKQTDYRVGAVIERWESIVTTEYAQLKTINPEYVFCDITSIPPNKDIKILESKIVAYECADVNKAIEVINQGVDLVETFDIKNMLLKLNEKMATS